MSRLYRRPQPVPAGYRAHPERRRLCRADLRLQGLGRQRGSAGAARALRPGRRRAGRTLVSRRPEGGRPGAARHLRHELRRRDGRLCRGDRSPGQMRRLGRRHRQRGALDAQRAASRRVLRPARPLRRRPRQPRADRPIRIRRTQRNPAAGPAIGRACRRRASPRAGRDQPDTARIRRRHARLQSGMGR